MMDLKIGDNLFGRRFGYWTVIGETSNIEGNGGSYWHRYPLTCSFLKGSFLPFHLLNGREDEKSHQKFETAQFQIQNGTALYLYSLKSEVPCALEGQISLISLHKHTVFLPGHM